MGAAVAGIFIGLIPAAVHAAPADPQDPAYIAGTMVGMCLVLLSLGLGIVKCISIMRRSTTSTLCVTSLLLMLLAWLVSSFANMPMVKEIFGNARGLALVSLLITTPLCLGSLIIGIVGLALYDRQRFHQGRAQAIWGVVLSSIFLLMMVGGFVLGMINNIKARGDAEEVDASPTGQPQTYARPELNFSLTPPDTKWISLKPEIINPVASLVLRRSGSDLYCMVIAEAAGDAASVKTDMIAEIARASLAGAVNVISRREEKETVNGIVFSHSVSGAKVRASGLEVTYEHWITAHNGFAYQLIFWSGTKTAALQAKEVRRMVETFHILDNAKVAGDTGTGSYKDVKLPQWGYNTHFGGLGWNEWTAKETRPALAITATFKQDSAMLVLPLKFEGDGPDLPALSRGLLSVIPLDYSKEAGFQTVPFKLSSGEGVEITTNIRDTDGRNFSYLFRVIKGRRVAHLIGGWIVEGNTADIPALRKAMDAVEVLPETTGTVLPSEKNQRQAMAKVFNQIGLSYVRRHEWEVSASYFKTSFGFNEKDAEVLDNFGYVMRRANKSKDALEYLKPLAGKFAKGGELGQTMAWLTIESGDEAGGQEAFMRCIELGLKSEDDLLEWLKMQVGKKHYDEALKAADLFLKKTPSTNAMCWKAQVLSQADKLQQAVDFLEQAVKDQPKVERLAYELGEMSNENGNFPRAALIAEKLIKEGHDTVRARMILGWSQSGRKWYREAKATFEAAAKLDPDDEDVKRALTRASADLGQGDNTNLKNPIVPVPMPESLKTKIAEAQKSPPPAGDASVLYLLRATGYHFKKGTPMRTTIFRRIQVLNNEGVNQFSTMEFPFDPLGERIYVNRLVVKDATGQTVAQSSIDDAYVMDRDPKEPSFRKILHVQVPALKPGCFIEAEVTREDRWNTEEFPFTRYAFGHALPIACEAVFVTGDSSPVKIQTVRAESLHKVEDPKSEAWICTHPPLFTDEPMKLPPGEFQPLVLFAGKDKDWAKVGLDYLKDISNRLNVDDTLRSTATKVLEGITGEKEKVTALARHAQKSLTYKAIEFGVRARRPNNAADTLRQQFGDCKDHAVVLHLLLKAAGIESDLVLVHFSNPLTPELPSLDQFNHMIVKVPSLGDSGWIDITDKQLLPATLPPEDLWKREALVLDPKAPHLEKLPGIPAGSASIVSQRNVSPEGTSDWRVEETLTAGGYYGGWLRSSFSGEDSAARTAHLQRMLDGYLSTRVQEATFEGMDDPEKPATVHAVYLVRNAVVRNGAERSAILPAPWEKNYLQVSFIKKRQTPFRFRMPFEMTSDVSVHLPSPPKKSSIASMRARDHSEYCSWEMESTDDTSSTLRVHFHFKAQTGTHGAESYNEWYEAWEKAHTAWDARLTWEQKP